MFVIVEHTTKGFQICIKSEIAFSFFASLIYYNFRNIRYKSEIRTINLN